MKTTKKKPSIPLIIIGALLAAYAGYLLNGAWHQGIEFGDFVNNMTQVLSYPLRDYYNESTLKAVIIFEIIFAMVMLMYYTSQRTMMPGREYGTARLATPKEINKVIKDKDDGKNRILSQNVRMSLDTRLTKLNNNVLIIGGSGSGKTFYEVKPNLMQRNSSFIIVQKGRC